MKWNHVAKIGAAAAVLVAVLTVALVVLSDRDETAKGVDEEASSSQVAENAVPEYLAFVSEIQAGGIYEVSDSQSSEFEREDEDNEPAELDDEELEELESEQAEELDDLLSSYGLERVNVDLSSLEEFDISDVEELGSIEPGIYVTPVDAKDCEYRLYRTMADGSEQLIGSDSIVEGRLIVNINAIEPDRFYSSPGCREWSKWSAITNPLTSVGSGDYWIGDLAAGTWQVGLGCIWERVGDFRGAKIADVLESGNVVEEVVISNEETGLRIRGCTAPMIRVDSTVPTELAFVDDTFEPVEQRRSTRRR